MSPQESDEHKTAMLVNGVINAVSDLSGLLPSEISEADLEQLAVSYLMLANVLNRYGTRRAA